ncbi:UPF0718 protein YcgR [Pullulanibacillus camelliae]|uniref:UPF0718 protein YcgR n=1 Tax=Pullulanibacillus camelliae TaxID=1707096 RepID=A0A8J2VWJ5_9BACL|nr:permease [Pullulanibacillus camelliae]GGE39984.1 UPF0718 protein YcgR [Pullulanibacillus camelliae]
MFQLILKIFRMESLGVLLLILCLMGFLLSKGAQGIVHIQFPYPLQETITTYLGILLEALPFILIGTLFSGIIQVYLTEDRLKRWLPKSGFLAIFPAIVIAVLFPVCDCAIIPVAYRLIKKGVPTHIGAIFLIIPPIVNPIVALSTYYAFNTTIDVLVYRICLALILTILVSATLLYVFQHQRPVQKERHGHHHDHDHSHHHEHHRWRATLSHAIEDFVQASKLLMFGAFIAAGFQTFIDQQHIMTLQSNTLFSNLFMMGLAFILSVCSQADAFVAASFYPHIPLSAVLAFLLLGPILDIKNTLMLFSYFKWRFVLVFMMIVSIYVLILVSLVDIVGGHM